MSGSDWTPIHHVEADDPEVQESVGNTDGSRSGAKKTPAAKGEAKSGVTLTLALPDNFTKAVVKAIEENTKVLQEILKAMKRDGNRTGGGGASPSSTLGGE